MDQERIIRFWHAVELLQPQEAPKIEKRNKPFDAFFHDVTFDTLILPWMPQSEVAQQRRPEGRIWSHTLYAHLYGGKLVAETLKKHFGEREGYRESSPERDSALFVMKFSDDGCAIADSLVLSSEAWFLGKVLAKRDWTRGFEAEQQKIREDAQSLLGGVMTGEALRKLIRMIRRFLGVEALFGDVAQYRLRFRSQPIKATKPELEEDPLNSFFLEDLANIADEFRKGSISAPLNQYLRRHDPERHLPIDGESASSQVIEHLAPDRYPLGCWPTERHLGLVHSQQLAVNVILGTLNREKGLMGINGPPGTGKTTLLRDLIAAIIVQRADALASLPRASDAFRRDGRRTLNEGGTEQICHELNERLFGFEIALASSNNGAVENVTLELPQRDKIDASWLPEIDYFADVGGLLTNSSAWGLISAALGTKARRNNFVSGYFYGRASSANRSRSQNRPADENEIIDDESAERGMIRQNAPKGLGPRGNPDLWAAKSAGEAKGLLPWLNAKAAANELRTSEQRREIWQAAILDYETAKEEAAHIAAKFAAIRDILPQLQHIRQQLQRRQQELHALEQEKAAVTAELGALDDETWKKARKDLEKCLDDLLQHQSLRPDFWTSLRDLWTARRRWNVTQRLLKSKQTLAQREMDRLSRTVDRLNKRRKELDAAIGEAGRALKQQLAGAQSKQAEAMKLAAMGKAGHLAAWLKSGEIGRNDAIELAEPWIIEGWRQARARVFIKALHLHRTFFELEAKRLRANLSFANRILTGNSYRGLPHSAIRSVWASLFMVVPVLSSTFASFARTFGSLKAGDIGWLLVDEAGQAIPQAAVGALWRADRAVLVGDPLQLKPILTVSDAVLEHMRTRYDVDNFWLPNRQSAQSLADEATRYGRMIGPATKKAWVGLPLTVHRRCDRPMFSIANRIAYGDAMVYGTIKPSPGQEIPASLPTGWIHVGGPSEGNWVPAEGEALQRLIALLQRDGVAEKNISVITPFRAVRNQLKNFLPTDEDKDKRIVYGTIHTMQGKESAVVIMILGGDTTKPQARNWAVSEPNLLNVAVTRAKRRLYIIGDYNDWKEKALFCEVMDLLPLQQLPPTA